MEEAEVEPETDDEGNEKISHCQMDVTEALGGVGATTWWEIT
jgi:hypothetical protein